MNRIHRYILLSVMVAVWSNSAVAKEESIDALVAAYQKASQNHAYKIMNKIKQKIAAMSKHRQKNAIEKVRNAVEIKENSVKKSSHSKALDSMKGHISGHPDPLSVMSGIGSHGSNSHSNGGFGGMSGGQDGGLGGMGDGPGGGMSDGPGGGMGGGMGGRR